jgi:uncharacterized protein YndB with AHSA1/START domain
VTQLSETIIIDRPPEVVFAYATDFAHFAEWQGGIAFASTHEAGQPGRGAKAIVGRRVGPRTIKTTEEITAYQPPLNWTVRATGGPANAIAHGTIEPLDDARRSRVTISLEFEPHGIGRLLVPLAIQRQARKQLPKNLQHLKRQLEEQ